MKITLQKKFHENRRFQRDSLKQSYGGGISDRISAKHRLKKSGAQRMAVPYIGPYRTWPVRAPDSAPGEF